MLRLYTDGSKFSDEEVLYNNDAVFTAYTSEMDFCCVDREFMLKYDGAQVIGKNALFGLLVKTRYDGTYIANLSTGLKTLLNLRHMKEMPQYVTIDITEAGENILLDIFEQVANLDIPVILRHANIPYFKGISILVDDEEIMPLKHSLRASYARRSDVHE